VHAYRIHIFSDCAWGAGGGAFANVALAFDSLSFAYDILAQTAILFPSVLKEIQGVLYAPFIRCASKLPAFVQPSMMFGGHQPAGFLVAPHGQSAGTVSS